MVGKMAEKLVVEWVESWESQKAELWVEYWVAW
jgi:hypothetical protein